MRAGRIDRNGKRGVRRLQAEGRQVGGSPALPNQRSARVALMIVPPYSAVGVVVRQ